VSEKDFGTLRPKLHTNLLRQKFRQERRERGRRFAIGHRHDRAMPL
jgi:hypothetical protein